MKKTGLLLVLLGNVFVAHSAAAATDGVKALVTFVLGEEGDSLETLMKKWGDKHYKIAEQKEKVALLGNVSETERRESRFDAARALQEGQERFKKSKKTFIFSGGEEQEAFVTRVRKELKESNFLKEPFFVETALQRKPAQRSFFAAGEIERALVYMSNTFFSQQ